MRVSLISIYNRDEAYLSDSGNREKKTYENTSEKCKIHRWKIIMGIHRGWTHSFANYRRSLRDVTAFHDASLNKLETREVLDKYEFQTATIRMTVSLPSHPTLSFLSQPTLNLFVMFEDSQASRFRPKRRSWRTSKALSTRSSQERLVLIKWLTCRSSFRLPETLWLIQLAHDISRRRSMESSSF